MAAEPAVTQAERDSVWAKTGTDPQRKTIVVLPGSRRSEIERLSDTFVAAITAAGIANAQVIIPTLPHLSDRVAAVFAPLLRGNPSCIVDGAGMSPEAAARERLVAMACADVALAASGTVSLELAAASTPMVIAYDMNWISRQIISRMLLTDTVTLVNLVSDTRVVPEFIGAACQPGPIGTALGDVLADPSAQLAALDTTMTRLGRGGDAPGLRAARAVLARL